MGFQLTGCKACDACLAGSNRVGCGDQSPGYCQACSVGKYQPLQAYAAECLECASASCPPGFERVGCVGPSAGTCQGIVCDALPPTAFGTVIFSNSERRYPATATYV